MSSISLNVKVIPHAQQRYETCGDYWWEGSTLYVRVSGMGNSDYEMCVAVHEVIEALLCRKRGISGEAIDEFDMEFEARREAGNEDEPGDDPKAPYRKEHFFATTVERLLSSELGVDWSKYDEAVQALYQGTG